MTAGAHLIDTNGKRLIKSTGVRVIKDSASDADCCCVDCTSTTCTNPPPLFRYTLAFTGTWTLYSGAGCTGSVVDQCNFSVSTNIDRVLACSYERYPFGICPSPYQGAVSVLAHWTPTLCWVVVVQEYLPGNVRQGRCITYRSSMLGVYDVSAFACECRASTQKLVLTSFSIT